MPKEFFVVGNWKMHKTIVESEDFVNSLSPSLVGKKSKVGLAVPFTALYSLSHLIRVKKIPLSLGAQNMHEKPEGAFTGEISSRMVKESGASFVILGHSERRHIFHESDELINQKIKRAIQEDLKVIFCVGEKGNERESGQTKEVIQKQIEKGLEGVDRFDNLILAYEPVWAIGTGKVAKAEDAQEVHCFCRKLLEKKFGQGMSDVLQILYGGSVQSDNVALLAKMKDIDGFLVGGASLKVESFLQIIEKCEELSQ